MRQDGSLKYEMIVECQCRETVEPLRDGIEDKRDREKAEVGHGKCNGYVSTVLPISTFVSPFWKKKNRSNRCSFAPRVTSDFQVNPPSPSIMYDELQDSRHQRRRENCTCKTTHHLSNNLSDLLPISQCQAVCVCTLLMMLEAVTVFIQH